MDDKPKFHEHVKITALQIADWICDTFSHWMWAIGSSAIAIIIGTFTVGGAVISPHILIPAVAFGFLVASFLAWRDERNAKDFANKEKERFKTQIKTEAEIERKKRIDDVIEKSVSKQEQDRRGFRLHTIIQAGAANLATNEEVIEVCNRLGNLGAGHPFGGITGVVENDYLPFLLYVSISQFPIATRTFISYIHSLRR